MNKYGPTSLGRSPSQEALWDGGLGILRHPLGLPLTPRAGSTGWGRRGAARRGGALPQLQPLLGPAARKGHDRGPRSLGCSAVMQRQKQWECSGF